MINKEDDSKHHFVHSNVLHKIGWVIFYVTWFFLINEQWEGDKAGVHLQMQCISAAEKRSVSGQLDPAMEGWSDWCWVVLTVHMVGVLINQADQVW